MLAAEGEGEGDRVRVHKDGEGDVRSIMGMRERMMPSDWFFCQNVDADSGVQVGDQECRDVGR